jgi:hypothetical protein
MSLDNEAIGWTILEHTDYLLRLAQTDPKAFREEYVQLVRDARDLLVVERSVRREICSKWELRPFQFCSSVATPNATKRSSNFIATLEYMHRHAFSLLTFLQDFPMVCTKEPKEPGVF